MLTYDQLIKELHNTDPQPNPLYYSTILANHEVVLLEIARRNQGVVAKELDMSLPKFNAIVAILRELSSQSLTISKM